MSNLTTPLQVALVTEGEDAKRADLPAIRDSFLAQVQELKTTAETLTVTDATQLTEMKLARKTRLSLRDVRLAVESRHKELKTDILKRGQELDAFKRQLIAIIEPLEARMLEQEEFAERAEAARLKQLASDRLALLTAAHGDATGLDLGVMPEGTFAALLAGAKSAHRQRLVDAQLAKDKEEDDRRKAQEERERITAENARLKAEAESQRRERAAAEFEAERKRISERDAAKQERDRLDAIAAEERKAREKVEAELAAKKKAEADAEKARIAAKKKAAQAPDRAKLEALANAIGFVPIPVMTTQAGITSAVEVHAAINALVTLIQRRAEAL